MSLSNEPCMARPTITDLSPVDLNYYPFMIRLDKCNGSCNAVDDLSTKICVPGKTKDVNFKVFNMIIKINDAKTLAKHISCDSKCKLTCNRTRTKDYSWNPSTCICENGKYLKSITDTLVIMCNKIISSTSPKMSRVQCQ